MSNNTLDKITNFLFEAAALKRTPRTGYQFLGRGHENVAEHSFGATLIAYVLGRLNGKVNMEKLLTMTLFHDLPEARCGDLNYVNKRYVKSDEEAALEAATCGLEFKDELKSLRREWTEASSLEANLAADADQLDMMVELSRLASHGWLQAKTWLSYAEKRLKTKEAKELAQSLSQSDPDSWWFENNEKLWVNPQEPDIHPLSPQTQNQTKNLDLASSQDSAISPQPPIVGRT
ncbi:MAG: HD family hydrolase [Deltaproteobacteria bacterium]|jgi:putative hydrolase of HD superfamily|nr:HD family hydrolase [Deltaproteobacteria bacterium]